MDVLTRNVQVEIPWCMSFANDIVLIEETWAGVNDNLQLWRNALESKLLRPCRSKTEHVKCKFSNNVKDLDGEVSIGIRGYPEKRMLLNMWGQ